MTRLRAFIAEDEPPARERLQAALAHVAPWVDVVGHASTVRGTQAWLAAEPAPDLLLADIQLADGLSLELFADGRLLLPTIFTTAYDRFAIEAFRALAVDYLLKPVSAPALAAALHKLQQLRQGFGAEARAWLQASTTASLPQRLVGRRGAVHQVLPLERLAYLVSQDKLTWAVDRDGERLLLDRPLAELETGLDARRFFRLNRQLLVAAEAVRQFTPAGKGRLRVQLQPDLAGGVWVSQERAAEFRAWLGG
jgi:DNA-binding LytR/AlgR family response regulator